MASVIDSLAEEARLRSPSEADRNQAWRILYDEQFEVIYRLVRRSGVLPAEAEDVAQRVFVRAHERLLEVEDVQSVRAWLRGIAVRVVSEHHRWRRIRRLKEWLLRASAEAVAPPPSPEQEAEAARVQAEIGAVLARMSAKLRAVLVLSDLEELGPTEVAEILAIPVNTVRSRRRLAREEFRRLWTGRRP